MSKILSLALQVSKQDLQVLRQASWYKKSAIRRLLNRADVFNLPAHNEFERLAYLFHQPDLVPIAACCASVDFAENPAVLDKNAWWLKVDPVQKIPNGDTLVMIPPADLQLKDDEKQQLGQAFNQHFASQGVSLEFGKSGDWYLKLPQTIDLKTNCLNDACYCNLQDLMPSGTAAGFWRSLMNETEMLFYNHQINIERRAEDLPEVNSIWLWGEGSMAQFKLSERPSTIVFSNEIYARGMANLAGAVAKDAVADYQTWAGQSQGVDASLVLMKFDNPLTEDDWLRLNQDWFEIIEERMKLKRLQSVFVTFGQQQGFLLEPKFLQRFWRWRDKLSVE